jgi:hypothetical protein
MIALLIVIGAIVLMAVHAEIDWRMRQRRKGN